MKRYTGGASCQDGSQLQACWWYVEDRGAGHAGEVYWDTSQNVTICLMVLD